MQTSLNKVDLVTLHIGKLSNSLHK